MTDEYNIPDPECPKEDGRFATDYTLYNDCYGCPNEDACRKAHKNKAARLKKALNYPVVFFNIPIALQQESNLDSDERIILAFIMYAYHPIWEHAKLTNETIAAVCNLSKDQVSRAIRGYKHKYPGLIDKGYLKIERMERQPNGTKAQGKNKTKRKIAPTLKTVRLANKYVEYIGEKQRDKFAF